MSSLFDTIGQRYERNPHQQAEYLGNGQWDILGTTWEQSVSTVGTGTPTVGRRYPAFCKDPDSWRNWIVFVESEHRSLEVSPTAQVILEWVASLGTTSGKRSIPLTPGDTVTALSGSAEEVAELEPICIRSSASYLYWFESDFPNLIGHRMDREGATETHTWEDVDIFREVCGLLDEGLFAIASDDMETALLEWGVTEPVWKVNHFENEDVTIDSSADLWGDVLEVEHPEDGPQLLFPWRNNSPRGMGYLRVDRSTGALVAEEFISLGTRPEEDVNQHPDSPNFPRNDAVAGCYGASWTTHSLGDQVSARGLFKSGETLVPALIFSDTLFGLDPADNSEKWRFNGGESFSPSGTHGEETTFERYTVVACDDSRALVWVCEFTYTYHDNPTIYEVELTDSAVFFMSDADINDVQDEAEGTRVVRDSFNDWDPGSGEWHEVEDGWVFYPSEGPSPGGLWSTASSTISNAFSEALASPMSPWDEQQLVLSGVRYGYRVVDTESGETLSNWWLRDHDGPSIDGTRVEPKDHESLEIPTGEGSVSTRSHTFSWDAWSGITGDSIIPELAQNYTNKDLTPSVANKVADYSYFLMQEYGTMYIPNNLYPEDVSPFWPWGPDGSPTEPMDLMIKPTQTIRGRARSDGDSLDIFIGPDAVVSEVIPLRVWPFNDPDVFGTNDFNWASNTTSVDIAVTSIMYPTHKIPLQYDALPRWDAVEGVLCGDQILFGPGHRNAGVLANPT